MGDRVTYSTDGAVATIAMDDGKVNVLSLAMFQELGSAFDQAEADGKAVVLAGRDGMFSGGFDLSVIRSGDANAVADMMKAGFELSLRMVSFPRPVVVACTGHAIAMGFFLVLSGDDRVGAAGSGHKLIANEVAIGMTMPRTPIHLCREKLTPAHFQRVVIMAEQFDPESALAAGILDRLAPGAVLDAARESAERLAGLDATAFRNTKVRAREGLLVAMPEAIAADDADLRALAS
jgi:enoyl-CoA hydratase